MYPLLIERLIVGGEHRMNQYFVSLLLVCNVSIGFAAEKSAPHKGHTVQIDNTFQDALSLYRKGAYASALQAFEKNIRQYPENKTIDYNYGWGMKASALVGQYDKSIQYCDIISTKYTGWVTAGELTRKWDDFLLDLRVIIERASDLNAEQHNLYLEKVDNCIAVAKKNTPAITYPEFEMADQQWDGKNVRFAPFNKFFQSPIDWDSFAPTWIIPKNIESPSKTLLNKLKTAKQDDYGIISFSYGGPAPEYITNAHYYLVSSLGIQKLTSIKLERVVQFGFDTENSKIQFASPMAGLVASEAVSISTHMPGGFIMHLPENYTVKTNPLAKEQSPSKSIEVRETLTKGEEDLILKEDSQTKIRRRFVFTVNGSKYIFIQWDSDSKCKYGCCNFIYTLFKVGEKLERVSTALYGCDV